MPGNVHFGIHFSEETIMDKAGKGQVWVAGGRGRLGLALVRAFAAQGWQVFAQTSPGREGPSISHVTWVTCNVADMPAWRAQVGKLDAVVHALNPRRYSRQAWRQEALAMLEASVALAVAHGAHLLFPGNVYNYGSTLPERLLPDTPHRPDTVHGQVRDAMEQHLAQAAAQQRLQATVIRAGNFFGSGSGTWVDRMFTTKLRQGRMTYPGPLDVGVAWAYLPDLADAFVRVAEARQQAARQPGVQVLHFAGHTLRGSDWLQGLSQYAREQGWLERTGGGPNVTGEPLLRLASLPWWAMRVLAWFVPDMQGVFDMRYLWQRPHALDGAALAGVIGTEPHTPWPTALRETLRQLDWPSQP